MWKSSQKLITERPAVRCIAWLDACGRLTDSIVESENPASRLQNAVAPQRKKIFYVVAFCAWSSSGLIHDLACKVDRHGLELVVVLVTYLPLVGITAAR